MTIEKIGKGFYITSHNGTVIHKRCRTYKEAEKEIEKIL